MKKIFQKKIFQKDKQFTKTGGTREQKTAIIHIKCTKNNTIYTLTDLYGNTCGWVSGGSVGYRHSRKTSYPASEKSARKILSLTKKCGYNSLVLKVKGYTSRKKGFIRPLLSKKKLKKKKYKFSLEKIINSTSVPFNGCRSSLRRRK